MYPSQLAHGAILRQLPFSARLQTSTGVIVNDGNYSITFSIYNVDTGGVALWTETQTVAVANGIVAANLGAVTAIPANLTFNEDSYYLGVKVGSDPEMTPRKRIAAVPMAFNADTVDGLHAGTGANNVLALDSSGNINFPGAVTAGSWQGTAISPLFGGTGLTSYTAGDLLYASGSNTLGKLSLGGDGQVLTVSGGTISWQSFSSAGDITSVAAGSGLSGGGTTGDVTLSLNLGNANLWTANQSINVTGANAFALTGTPATSATSSLLQMGSAIASGSANGTYIGINPASFSGNFVDFQVNGSSRYRVSSAGDVVAGGTVTANALSVTNNALVGGTLGVTGLTTLGDLQVNGNTAIGNATTDTITITASLNSNIIPAADGTYDLGSPSFRFRNFYADQAVFNQTTIDNTTAASFVINADNATADTESSTLEFHRGSVTPHAIIRWDATNDRFDLNQNVLLQGTFTAGNAATDSTTLRGAVTLQDSDVSHVLLFGADTNLYRSGNDTLATADSLTVGGTLAVTSTINGATISGGTLSGGSLSTTALQGGGSFTITGGTGASETLTLISTSDVTKGNIQFFSSSNTISSSGVLTVAGAIRSSASSNQIVLNSGGVTGTLTWTPTTSNKVITFPDETGTVCTTATVCSGYAAAAGGSFIAKNANDTSTASFVGNLLHLQNTNSGAAGVLQLTNVGINSALTITQSGNPQSGQAIILANNSNGTPSGNLIDLQTGAVSRFIVTHGGNVGVGTTSTNLNSQSRELVLSAGASGTVNAGISIQGSQSVDNSNFGQINFFNGANNVAVLSARRDGGDTSGTLIFSTSNAGSLAERLRVTSTGTLSFATTATIATTSTGATALTVNGPSGLTANLLDLQVNSSSKFSVNSAGAATITAAGAASTPAAILTGTWFTGGTTTTTKPQLLIEPSGATSNNWSTSGTGLGINGASGFAGNLLDIQLNGAARFRVSSAGDLTVSGSGTHTFSGTIQVSTLTSSGTLSITSAANGNISLTPNGTGDIVINTDSDSDLIIGDGGTTNYTKFDTNGTLSVAGAARPYNEISLLPDDVNVTGASQCTLSAATAGTDATNPITYKTVDCDATAKDAHWQFKMPQNYVNASNVQIDVYWLSDATSGAATIDAGYVAVADTATWKSAAITNVTGASKTSNGANTINTSTITLTSPSINANDLVNLRIRDSAQTLSGGSTNKVNIVKVRVKYLVGS